MPFNALKIDFHLDENCDLLDYYAASGGDSLPTFRDNLSVSSSRVGLTPKKFDQQVVPKRRQGIIIITTTRCVITQKSAVLVYFAAEAQNQDFFLILR